MLGDPELADDFESRGWVYIVLGPVGGEEGQLSVGAQAEPEHGR